MSMAIGKRNAFCEYNASRITIHDIQITIEELSEIGKKLEPVSEEQMKFICAKMYRIFFNRFALDAQNFPVQGTVAHTPPRSVDIKTCVLSRATFMEDMKNDFPLGMKSIIARGGIFEYSYDDLFCDSIHPTIWAMYMSFKEYIGTQLAQWPNYRINLSLDIEKTKQEKELVFTIFETTEKKEVSRFFFGLQDLELENIEKNKELDEPCSSKIAQFKSEIL